MAAAGLLAQVLPVGILTLVFEAGQLRRFPRRRLFRHGPYNHVSWQVCGVVGGFNAISVFWCVQAVATNVPMTGFTSGYVAIAGSCMVGAAVPLLFDIAFLTPEDEEEARRIERDRDAALNAATAPPRREPHSKNKQGPTRKRRRK